jgi:hypothetical protein
MSPESSPTLLRILRTTLLEVERALELSQCDPGLRNLKHSILLAIGELEMLRAASRVRILWIRPSSAGCDDGI